MHKIAVFGSCHKIQEKKQIEDLIKKIESLNVDVLWEKNYLTKLGKIYDINTSDKNYFSKKEHDNIDFALSLGGDGTLLRVSKILNNKTPILGINMGSLGFLTDIDCSIATEDIENLLSGNYSIVNRMMLDVYINNIYYETILNEIAILKRETGSMINIETYLNDKYLANYDADGLIIATPTGSTAYSLSAGGPILTPECENIIITPIAPHTLTMRSLVIPDKGNITLRPHSRTENFLLNHDGNTIILEQGSVIDIKKSDKTIKTIHISNKTFADTIREKLMWGTSTIDRSNKL